MNRSERGRDTLRNMHTACRAGAGASSCTACSPGTYSASTGPGPRHRPAAWRDRVAAPSAFCPDLAWRFSASETRRHDPSEQSHYPWTRPYHLPQCARDLLCLSLGYLVVSPSRSGVGHSRFDLSSCAYVHTQDVARLCGLCIWTEWVGSVSVQAL